MRVYDRTRQSRRLLGISLPELGQLLQKRHVFLRKITLPKVFNFIRLVLSWALKRAPGNAFPVHLKIDIVPKCQLACPVCLHGSSEVRRAKSGPMQMNEALFRRLVDQVAGKTHVMSLYNLGEPLLHKRLPDMAAYAEANGINTYITTNLSLPLSGERIDRLVDSGLAMIIVAVDGISEDTYGRERIGGDLSLILGNLTQIVAAKRRSGATTPRLTVQFIEFDFNTHERDEATRMFDALGVDELTFIRGHTTPWLHSNRRRARPRPARLTPHCAWPYFSAVVNSDGTLVQCCNYRMSEVLLSRSSVSVMGNLATQSLRTIFNGPAARDARRISSNPVAAAKRIAGHFCEGCVHIARD